MRSIPAIEKVMAFRASTGGVTGEMIRDLMLESVEQRFGSTTVPHPVQWLSDKRQLLSGARDDRLCDPTRPRAMLYAGAKPPVERHGRIVRQNLQAGLRVCSRSP